MGTAWSSEDRKDGMKQSENKTFTGCDRYGGLSSAFTAASMMNELAERTLRAATVEKDAADRGEHVNAKPGTEVVELERQVILELHKGPFHIMHTENDAHEFDVQLVSNKNSTENDNDMLQPEAETNLCQFRSTVPTSKSHEISQEAPKHKTKRSRRAVGRKHNANSSAQILAAALTLSSHALHVLIASPVARENFAGHSEVTTLDRHTAACFVRAAREETKTAVRSPASVHFLVHHDPSLSRLTNTLSSQTGALGNIGVLFCVRVILQEERNVGGSSTAAHSSIFKVICECDPLSHVRDDSSSCVHAQTVSNELWSTFSPSASGRDVRSILRILNQCPLKNDDVMNSHGFPCASVIRDNATSDRSVQAVAICFGNRGRNGQSIVAVTCSATKECGGTFHNYNFRCSVCRSDTASRGSCSHQVAAKEAFSGLLLSYADDEEYSSEDSDNEKVDRDSQKNHDAAPPLRRKISDRYVSRRGRSPLSCWSDIISIRRRLDLISEGSHVYLRDITGVCIYCNFEGVVSEHCVEIPRACTLETARGQARCFVSDWRCPSCARQNYFDGLDEAVVVGSRDHLYCRSVLDYLMEELFADGKTFHGAHASFSRSLRLLGENGSSPVGCARRRRMSDGFSVLVSLVGDAPGSPGSISSALKCTSGCADEDGKPKFLVIDGTTAAAHKNPLNAFQRKTVLIKPIRPNNAREQFILKHEPEREAVRHLCIFGILALKSGGAFVEDEWVDISRSLGKVSTTLKVRSLPILAFKTRGQVELQVFPKVFRKYLKFYLLQVFIVRIHLLWETSRSLL